MAVAGRALFLKLPLTVVITAMFAHWIAGLPCIESLLIGAVLAPTDPVFAAALVGNDTVPARLRQLLNLESGVNDGLALPFVLIFLATASGSPDLQLGTLAGELVLGLAIGVGVPWVAIRLEATRSPPPRPVPAVERVRHRPADAGPGSGHPRQSVPRGVRRRYHHRHLRPETAGIAHGSTLTVDRWAGTLPAQTLYPVVRRV